MMFKLILIVVVVLGLAVAALSVKIIFHRSHKFPATSIEGNAQMRQRGITCPRHDELARNQHKRKTGCESCTNCTDCSSCA